MAISNNTSISSLLYNPELNRINQSLASGLQINQSADNPAGQAVVAALTSQINTQDIATRNANDGISLIQTADGASASISSNLQRLNELAIQAQNGTLNDAQRTTLNTEFQQNLEAINQTASSTQFNGQNLLDGSNNTLSIALGETNSDISLFDQSTTGLSLNGLDISNAANAANALNGVTSALEQLNTQRAGFGSQQNGLISSIDNLQTQNINSERSRSQIQDTNFAQAITEQVRQNILQDSAIAMQSQTNQSRASVLQLLNS